MNKRIDYIKKRYKKHESNRNEALRQEFLPEVLELVERPASPIGHVTMIVITLIILFTLLWSIFGRVDQIASARGKIATTNGVQLIQPIKGGMVTEVCVKEGDSVKAGQVIMRLDDSVEDINIKNLRESLNLVKYENELLSTIVMDGDISEYLDASNHLTSKDRDQDSRLKVAKYVSSIQSEYLSKCSELDSAVQQNLLQVSLEEENLSKIKNSKKILKGKKEKIQSLSNGKGPENQGAEKIAHMISKKEKEVEDLEQLCNADAIPLTQLEEAQNELEQLRSDYEVQKSKGIYEEYNYSSSLSEIKEGLASAQADIKNQQKTIEIAKERVTQSKTALDNLKSNFTEKVTSLMNENDLRINTQQADLDIQLVNFNAQELVSPVNGQVKTLEANTVGGVVTAAQIVATVVADDTQLIVEALILNRDIGFIKVGQAVSVKLDSFNFQKYGKLDGTLIHFGPDAILDETIGWVYKGKIAIDKKELNRNGNNAEVIVGMEGTAEVKIGDRRIIDFFLEPLIEHFDSSLKVR